MSEMEPAHAALAQLKSLGRELDELRAEFLVEEEKRGKGEMSEEEHEAQELRLSRMHDEHVLWSFLAVSDLLHGRLAGQEWDLMRLLKAAFIETMLRSDIADGPTSPFATAMRLLNDGEGLDLDYLNEAAA
jgi:hypothetical protein